MLIPMQKHIQKQGVLIIVERVRERLEQLGVLDAEPGQRLRVGHVLVDVGRRILSVRKVEQSQAIRIVERFVGAVVDQHEEEVTALPG